MRYKPEIVLAYWREMNITEPEREYVFHPNRRWRFDFAWPGKRVYLEVDGGIWIVGGHSRGAQMKKDWEKRNCATALGWRGLWCEPKDLCTDDMSNTILDALAVDILSQS